MKTPDFTSTHTITVMASKILSVILVLCMLLCLFSCGDGKGKNSFKSVEDMADAICGTYTHNDNWYIISDTKMIFVDRNKLFDTSDEAVNTMVTETLSAAKLKNLTLKKLIELKSDAVTEYELEYDYQNRKIKYGDSGTIAVSESNTVFVGSNMLELYSENSDFPSPGIEGAFEDYHNVLLDAINPASHIPSSTEELYNKLKPFFKKTGYDFDEWEASPYNTDNLFQIAPSYCIGSSPYKTCVTYDKKQIHIKISEKDYINATYKNGKVDCVIICDGSTKTFDGFAVWDAVTSGCPIDYLLTGEQLKSNYQAIGNYGSKKQEKNGVSYTIGVDYNTYVLTISFD